MTIDLGICSIHPLYSYMWWYMVLQNVVHMGVLSENPGVDGCAHEYTQVKFSITATSQFCDSCFCTWVLMQNFSFFSITNLNIVNLEEWVSLCYRWNDVFICEIKDKRHRKMQCSWWWRTEVEAASECAWEKCNSAFDNRLIDFQLFDIPVFLFWFSCKISNLFIFYNYNVCIKNLQFDTCLSNCCNSITVLFPASPADVAMNGIGFFFLKKGCD